MKKSKRGTSKESRKKARHLRVAKRIIARLDGYDIDRIALIEKVMHTFMAQAPTETVSFDMPWLPHATFRFRCDVWVEAFEQIENDKKSLKGRHVKKT